MRLTHITLSSLALVLLVATGAAAQEATSGSSPDGDRTQIERPAAELSDFIDRRHDDRDIVDTAMVFTNAGDPSIVRCLARSGDGREVGRTWLKVPRQGLRFILASDIAHGVDFIGSVACSTHARVTGSALLVGAELTDLPTHRVALGGAVRLSFPLVITR